MQPGLDILWWFIGILLAYVLIAWVLHRKRWGYIERLNQNVGITRQNAYIGKGGYLHWKDGKRLCHRDIAYRALNHRGIPFSECDVHHRNGNKLDNNPENLQLLNREEHQLAHGEIIYENGKRYVRICRNADIARRTAKAVLVAGEWVPLSQTVTRGRYLYGAEWVVQEHGLSKLHVNPTKEGSAADWWRYFENNKEEVIGGVVAIIVIVIVVLNTYYHLFF